MVDITEIQNIIPILLPDIEVFNFDAENYIIQNNQYGHQIKISVNVYHLIELIDGQKTIKEICHEYNQKERIHVDINSVYELLYNKLGKYGIIQQSKYEMHHRQRANYLKLSFKIINNKTLLFFTNSLKWIFKPHFFFVTLIFLIVYISASIIFNFDFLIYHLKDLTFNAIPAYLIVFFLDIIFHEFGHATAARYYGAKHNGVGFGFYLFTPVFFTDVSDAWKLPSKQRLIVDIAGIYFEIIFASLILTMFYIFQTAHFLIISVVIVIKMINNLNPFLRYDGYWILSDALNITNLRKNSLSKLNQFSKSIFKPNSLKIFSKKDYFLVIYAIFSSIIIISFLVAVLLYNPNSVLFFFNDLYNLIESLISDINNISLDSLMKLILPAFFYFFATRFLLKYLKKWKADKTKSENNKVPF